MPLTKEEMRCVALLAKHKGEWVWYMTDAEYQTAIQAVERVNRPKKKKLLKIIIPNEYFDPNWDKKLPSPNRGIVFEVVDEPEQK